MAKNENTVSVTTKLIAPVAEEMGLKIWDIKFVKEGAGWFLRIFIEKDGGTSINDCVDFTHAINPILDEADPIPQAYCLEVCSPGLERELSKPEHFERYTGEKIFIKTIRPINGEKEFHGILEAYDAPNIQLRLEDGSGFSFTKKEVAWIKADDFYSAEE